MVTFPGEILAIKIIDTLEKGIGALARPWQMRREGKARAEVLGQEKLAIAQAEVEAEEIRQGRKALGDGELLALPAPTETGGSDDGGDEMIGFLTAAKAGADYLTVKRAINLRKIAVIAEEEAGETPDEEVSDEPVDPDWFSRWREAAQDVSNEQMQQIWARLLKGEVKKPGSFSLQTVSILRNMSSQQAGWIAALAQFSFGSWMFKSCDDLFDEAGLTLVVRLELESLGLLTSLEAVGGLTQKVSFELDPEEGTKESCVLTNHGVGILLLHTVPTPTLKIPIISILRTGRELISLGQFSPNQAYLKRVAAFCREKGFETFLVDTEQFSDNRTLTSNRRRIN